MIKLINIKRSDNFIEADYLPEDSKERGYVKVDTQTKEIIESRHSKYEEPYEKYSECRIMAARGLRELIEAKTIPEEKIIMWY